jgi:RNase P/RNase MRP subunit POP5
MVRFKNRYFVVELVFPDGAQVLQTDLHGGGIAGAIRESVDLNFGDWGAATAMMSLSGVDWLLLDA